MQVKQRQTSPQVWNNTLIQKPQVQDNTQLPPKEDISKELVETGQELQKQAQNPK
ncbi:hypothetical protein NHP200010_07940 [Helicobacter bizzozeronii]|nr:hypothetical protein NHP200010_07940 [Helicobacter bizzozeronii]